MTYCVKAILHTFLKVLTRFCASQDGKILMIEQPGKQLPANIIPPIPPREKEAVFQMRLAAEIEKYGHKVALRDAGTKSWKRRFKTNGICPDLLIETNPDWELHEALPVIALEAKVGEDYGITDVWDGIEKVIELKRKESELIYTVEDREIKPVFYLFTNPCLLKWDVSTYWHSNRPKDDLNCCASYFQKCLLVILSRYTSSMLTKDLKISYNGHVNGYQFSRLLTLKTGTNQYPPGKRKLALP